jgi:hypothetical protein
MAIDQGAGYPSIKKSGIRAMMFLAAPLADPFISFKKALYFEPILIVRAASVALSNWSGLV